MHCDPRMNAAILTIPFASMLAVYLLPADSTAPGGVLLAAWTMTAGLLGGILFEALERGTQRLFSAEHVLMLGIVVVVYAELLQPGYVTTFDDEALRREFLAIGLFATLAALGSSIRPMRLPLAIKELASKDYSSGSIFAVALLCFATAMFNFGWASHFSLNAMINGLSAGRWSAPWARGEFGGWDAFRDFLSNFGYVLPTLTVLLALRVRAWLDLRVVISFLCSLVIFAFITQGGARRVLVEMLGAAILTWLCAKRRELRVRHFLVIGSLLLVTVLFLDAVLSQRDTGFQNFRYTREKFKGLRVDDNFRMLGETLAVVPRDADFVGFQQLWYVIVRPVPRVFWPNKPTSPGFDLTQHLGLRGLSLSITAIGEAYVSFGWFGIAVFGFGFGWLARTWGQLLDLYDGPVAIALHGLGAMALFIGMRSLVELILLAYPILCWYAVDRIAIKTRRWVHQRGVIAAA